MYRIFDAVRSKTTTHLIQNSNYINWLLCISHFNHGVSLSQMTFRVYRTSKMQRRYSHRGEQYRNKYTKLIHNISIFYCLKVTKNLLILFIPYDKLTKKGSTTRHITVQGLNKNIKVQKIYIKITRISSFHISRNSYFPFMTSIKATT